MLEMAVTIVRSCDPAETEEDRRQARKEIASWTNTGGMSALPTVAFFVDHVTRAHGWLSEGRSISFQGPGWNERKGVLESGADRWEGGATKWPRGAEPSFSRGNIATLSSKAGWNAIQECEDVAIAAAREYVLLMRENEKLNADLVVHEEALYAELGQALLANAMGWKSAPMRQAPRALQTEWSRDFRRDRFDHRALPYDV